MAKPDTQLTDLHILCPECDYNLTGAPGARCPWCGWPIDVQLLVRRSGTRATAQCVGVASTSLLLGVGSLVAVGALLFRTGHLSLYDAVTVLAVVVAAGGHLTLAACAIANRRRWPLRQHDLGQMLRVAGWLSVASGIIGASGAMTGDRSARGVHGIVVSGAMELLVLGTLFTFPGWALLVLRMVSFRDPVREPFGEHPQGTTRQRGTRWRGRAAVERGAWSADDVERAPFVIDFVRSYRNEQLTVCWTDAPLTATPQLRSMIDHAWNAERALADVDGRLLQDGRLARLVRADAARDSIRLTLGATCYRDFVGTNMRNAGLVFRNNPAGMANPLGVSGLVVTRDGYLALGRRSRRVAFHAGFVHPFGGMVEEADRTDAGYDVFGSCVREVCEETGLPEAKIDSVVITALVRDRTILQPELVFDVQTSVVKEALQAVFDPGNSGGEHDALEFLYDEPDSTYTFLRGKENVSPVAQAALLAHGLRSWGSDWFEQTCYLLYGETPPKFESHVS